jgi:hypothetical protein
MAGDSHISGRGDGGGARCRRTPRTRLLRGEWLGCNFGFVRGRRLHGLQGAGLHNGRRQKRRSYLDARRSCLGARIHWRDRLLHAFSLVGYLPRLTASRTTQPTATPANGAKRQEDGSYVNTCTSHICLAGTSMPSSRWGHWGNGGRKWA